MSPKGNNEELQLIGHDIPWDDIDNKSFFNVVTFAPLATVVDGKVIAYDKHWPYANLEVRAKELRTNAILPITHKLDFLHIWQAYSEIGDDKTKEINVIWSNKSYKHKFLSRLKNITPKLTVWLNHKGAYYRLNNPDSHPKLTGTPRYRAVAPIKEWKPDIME